MICLAGIVFVLGLPPAMAQGGDAPDSGEQSQERRQLREQIQERIHQDPSLEPQQRERMQNYLEQCLSLGLRDDQIEALFPMDGEGSRTRSRHMLQWQERVMTAAEAGLAEDLLTDKLREGRMMGADAAAIDQVMERLPVEYPGGVLRLRPRWVTRSVRDRVRDLRRQMHGPNRLPVQLRTDPAPGLVSVRGCAGNFRRSPS